MDRVSRGLLALLAAAALLAVVWWRLPAASPPLYDGVCVANPYAYVSPPPGAPTDKPSSATHAVSVQQGVVPGTHVGTGEFPAQASMDTDDGSLVAPAGTTSVTLRIDPVAAPTTVPKDGRFDGNFYRVTASSGTGVVTVNPGKPVTITLRPTQVTGSAETVERLDGDRWTPLQTSLGNCSVFMSAASTTLGTFVLVIPGTTPGAQPTGGGGGGAQTPASTGFNPLGVIIAAVLLLAILFGLLRLSRTRGSGGRRQPLRRPPSSRRR